MVLSGAVMANNAEVIKLPRLYVDGELTPGENLVLTEGQSHYLRTVLRRGEGDRVRAFNGRDGEWLCAIDSRGRKQLGLKPLEKLRGQPETPAEIHLFFAPLKKSAMDWLVEKSVELGATHLHPVLTQNTEVRKINEPRLRQQIAEAAEQCERMDMPALSPLMPLDTALAAWNGGKITVCLERVDAPRLVASAGNARQAFLVGPEGGFTEKERAAFASSSAFSPVSLGDGILRAETAAIVCLSSLKISRLA